MAKIIGAALGRRIQPVRPNMWLLICEFTFRLQASAVLSMSHGGDIEQRDLVERSLNGWLAEAFRKRHELLERLPLIFRSRVSGFFQSARGNTTLGRDQSPDRRSSFQFGAIRLAHLFLEGLRTLIPHLVIQNALWSRISWTNEASTNVSSRTIVV